MFNKVYKVTHELSLIMDRIFLGPSSSSSRLRFVISPAGEPAPRDYVTDEAGIIGEDARRGISARLAELEGKTGAQMLVLTVLSAQGVPIEEFALRKAEAWKLGQKGKDNGLLLVVAVRDRKYRLEVGYGLGGGHPGQHGRDHRAAGPCALVQEGRLRRRDLRCRARDL